MMFKQVPSKRASCLFQQSLHLSRHYCPLCKTAHTKAPLKVATLKTRSRQTNILEISPLIDVKFMQKKTSLLNCLLYHIRFPCILSKHIVITMPPCFFVSSLVGFFSKEKMPRLSFLFAPHLLPWRRQQQAAFNFSCHQPCTLLSPRHSI